MRQVVVTRLGPYAEPPGPALELQDVAPLEAGAGEAVVAMKARPINPADLLLIEGKHLYKPAVPARVGIEGAGVVARVGEGVDLAVGTKVAVPYGGTWAEEVAIAARDLIPLPHDVDLEQAAMLPVNPYTAAGLLEGLRAGDWLIQNAANSAVGRLVSRIARRRGVHTVGVVRREAAIAVAAEAGPDHVLVDGDDLVQRVAAATGGARIIRALDAVAGAASGRLFHCLGDGGELVAYGLMASTVVTLPAAELIFKDRSVRGFSRLRVYSGLDDKRRAEVNAELAGMLRDGGLESEVDSRFLLEEHEAALARHLSPDRLGKVLFVTE